MLRKASEKSRVLLTGGRGFVGTHLSAALLDHGFEIHSCVRPSPRESINGIIEHFCPLENEKELGLLFDEVQPEFLIHLASRPIPNRNLDEFDFQFAETILPSISLAKTAPIELKLAVFVGSCEEYGNGPTPFHEDRALHCISPYGWGKISAYYAVSMIARQRGLPFCWLRPFLMFGPGQNTSQLIPSVISGCIENRVIPLTEGQQTRDIVYVDDACRMILKVLKNYAKARNEVINICSGVPRTVRSVSEMIQRMVGSGTLDFGRVPYRFNEAMSFYGSREKYEKLFGIENLSSLEGSMEKTIQFYSKRSRNHET